MSIRAYKFTVVVLFCVSSFLAWRCWDLFGQTVWFQFIEHQCAVTQDMIDHPPDGFVPNGLAHRLAFLMGYYDANSKALAGSRLEAVVRRDYERTLADAVTLFRRHTMKDLGSDPKLWIQEYGH